MRITFVLLMLTLAGCTTVGPAYDRPDMGLHDTDTFIYQDAPTTAPTEADLQWWERFDDPLMAQWVEQALAGNLDIAIAYERINQAAAALRAAQGGLRPSLDAGARASTTHRSGNTGNRSGTQADSNTTSASTGLEFDWALDLFGGLRQAERAAVASLMQQRDLLQATRLATAGLAARSYLAWREALRELALLEQTLELREETLRVVSVRVDVGLASKLDLVRARSDLASVRAEQDETRARVQQSELALQLLAGERPASGAFLVEPEQVPALPAMDIQLPTPRPVDLLRLRPDIRAAERALIASYANVGVAQSALYPQLRLPGELLLTATGLGTGSVVTSLTAGLSSVLAIPLFDGGRRAADLSAAQSRAREAALVYRSTVLEALEQAESALLAIQTTRSQLEARRAAAEASDASLEQVKTLYTEGLTDFLNVLEVQRTWLENQRELVRIQADRVRAQIALFEAMGLIDQDTPPQL
jgi:NodT family efflux transporter outer membrane factor (OMF) lipoprotein